MLAAAVALALALVLLGAPAQADDPVAGRVLVDQAQAAIAAREGVTAQLKLEQAIASGIAQDQVRHLLAHAYVLQGRGDLVRDMARADRVPAQYAAYAARMRAAVATDRASALVELENAIRLAPRDAASWSDLARQRWFGGDSAGASAAAERAVVLDPGNVDALVLSGTIVRARYGGAAALPWFDRAIARDPRNTAALLERAATLGDLGRTLETVASIRDVLAVDPKSPQAAYLEAVTAARGGDWVLARSLLYRVGGRLGNLAGQRMLAGTIELAQGNFEKAIVELGPLVARQPQNFDARRLLGAAHMGADDARAAIAVLGPIVERPDADVYALTLVGRGHERLGDRVAAGQWLDRAALPLKGAATPFASTPPAVQPDTTSARARIERGDALAAQQRWRDAADVYRDAANLDLSEDVLLRLVDATRRAGDAPATSAILTAWQAAAPANVAALLLTSKLAVANRDWARADKLLAHLSTIIGGRDATVVSHLAWVRHHQRRDAEALALGRAAYALAPNNPQLVASYGWLAHAAGERATASALLKKAVALAPDVAEYRARLAKVRAN